METGYGPLNGVRVIDFTHQLAGPTCTLMLADMGADVVKIERVPFEADEARNTGDPYWIDDVSLSYVIANRNKRTIPIDIKTDGGKAIIRRLLEDADVMVENFRPGVLDRLGFGYDAVKAFNPGIVYAAVSGFGRTGPYAERAGFDLVAQGMSGIMSVTGEGPGRPPVKAGVPMTDVTSGIILAMGVCAALRHREVTGEGQVVDTSLFEAGIIQTFWHMVEAAATGKAPVPLGSGHPLAAPYQAIKTKDGWIILGVASANTWKHFVAEIDPGMGTDPRFATMTERLKNVKALEAHLNAIFEHRTTDEWLAEMERIGVPAGPLLDILQMQQDPQTLARDMVIDQDYGEAGTIKVLGLPVKFSGTPAGPRHTAKPYGSQAREVLAEIGFAPDEIDALIAAGATADGME